MCGGAKRERCRQTDREGDVQIVAEYWELEGEEKDREGGDRVSE